MIRHVQPASRIESAACLFARAPTPPLTRARRHPAPWRPVVVRFSGVSVGVPGCGAALARPGTRQGGSRDGRPLRPMGLVTVDGFVPVDGLVPGANDQLL